MEKISGSIRKDYFWNTVGSGIYALSSMLLAFAAMHIAGPDDGGIFGFGFSAFGQQMFIIAYFGIRPFHITDSSYEYGYGSYRRLRRITAAAAAAAAAAYLSAMLMTGSYTMRKALIIFLLALYKIADGIADLYESECQRAGVLWLGGKELAVRTVLSSAVLIGVLAIGGDMLTAAAAAVLMQLACIVFFKKYTESKVFVGAAYRIDAKDGAVKGLAANTVLLFLSVFVDFYIFSASKYAIDRYLTDADSGIFNILFMPTSVIYLAANFIIKPYMTKLSCLYDGGEAAEFRQSIGRLRKAVLLLSAAAAAGSVILGRPVLTMLEYVLGSGYTGMLSSRSHIFVFIIIGGCCYALSNLYYYILIIMRRQKLIFGIYLIVAAAAFLMSSFGVSRYGLNGAAVVYLCYMLLAAVIFELSSRYLIGTACKSRDMGEA